MVAEGEQGANGAGAFPLARAQVDHHHSGPVWHLVPEASGRARDALDRAFAHPRMCPESAHRLVILVPPQVRII